MPLTDETRVAAREIVARYPRPRSALLPMLHLVQSEEGYVSPEGVRFCAEELGLTKAEVGAVATFYTMYKRRPTGEYLVSRLHQHAVRRARRRGDLRDAVRAARRRPRPDHRATGGSRWSTPSAWPPATTRRSSRSTTSSSTSRRPESAIELVERAAGGPAAAADPGRAAVHVQGDQPAAGRVHRRAAGRGRRRVGRRADADRRPAGGGAGGDGAGVRRADPARQAGRAAPSPPRGRRRRPRLLPPRRPRRPRPRGRAAAAPASAGEAKAEAPVGPPVETAAEQSAAAGTVPVRRVRRTSRPAAPARACRPRPPTPRPTRARTRSPSRLRRRRADPDAPSRNRRPVPPRTGRRPTPTAGARSGARRAEPCR